MKKYYAVREGRNPGIYETWSECKKQIDGYSNASYKSFKDLKSAKIFLNKNSNKIELDLDDKIIAYVDGSFDKKSNRFGYGVIMFYKGEKIVFLQSEKDEELSKLRNVAGELKGAMYVMKYALDNNIKNISLHYDYIGIEKWAIKEWKRNLPFTNYYSDFAEKIMNDVNIEFVKVKAHSGNEYNEEVDKLAKESIKNKKYHLEIDSIDEANELESKDEYDDKYNWSGIKSYKTTIKPVFYFEDKILSEEHIYKIFKETWSINNNIKDIEAISSIYDIKDKKFIFKVKTAFEESILEIAIEKFI